MNKYYNNTCINSVDLVQCLHCFAFFQSLQLQNKLFYNTIGIHRRIGECLCCIHVYFHSPIIVKPKVNLTGTLPPDEVVPFNISKMK